MEDGSVPVLATCYCEGHAMSQTNHQGHAMGDMLDAPAMHAFIVMGNKTIFLVHMTNMWMEPHRYQCILRVSVPTEVRKIWEDDPQVGPDDWYMISPAKPLVLADVARGFVERFKGALWRGWPTQEADGSWPWEKTPKLREEFDITVERVVYYRHFDFNLGRPNTATYIIFGKDDEAHLQSYQVKQPDMDHMLTLSGRPTWLPYENLEAGAHVNFPSVPAVPGGSIEPLPEGTRPRRYDVHCSAPVGPGTHYVQFCGMGPHRQLDVDRGVFFGTFPVNNPDPCKPYTPGEHRD